MCVVKRNTCERVTLVIAAMINLEVKKVQRLLYLLPFRNVDAVARPFDSLDKVQSHILCELNAGNGL